MVEHYALKKTLWSISHRVYIVIRREGPIPAAPNTEDLAAKSDEDTEREA